MSRTFNSIRNMIYGFLSRFIAILIPFFVRTAIIYKIGIEYAGLNSLFTSILSFLSLTELGFGSAIIYMLYKPIAENNETRINRILHFLRNVYRLIGSAIILLGVCLLPFLDKLVNEECPSDVDLQFLFLIYLLNTAIPYFMYSYKSILLNAFQRIDIFNKIQSVIEIIFGAIKIGVILMFSDYYLYVLCIPAASFVQNLIVGYIVSRKYPNLKAEGKLTKVEIKEIGKKVFALTGHKIGGTIVGSLDSIVISAMLGITILAEYSNYFMVISSLMGIIGVFMSSVLASVGNYLLDHSKEEKEELFYKLNFGMIWFVGWCSVCLICLYQPFMRLWLGEDFLLPFSSVICFGLYFYSWQFRVLIVNFKDAAGLWTQDVMKPYVASLVNIVLNIVLIKLIGLNGAMISTIICMFLIFFPWETEVLYRNLFLKKSFRFYLWELFYLLLWVIICCVTFLVCCSLQNYVFDDLAYMLICMVVCCIIPNVIFGVLNRKSKYMTYYVSIIKSMITSVVRKCKK